MTPDAAKIDPKTLWSVAQDRDARRDLRELLDRLEDAIIQGSIHGDSSPSHLAANRLVDAYHILRRWWA